MSAREFREWFCLEKIEPFGERGAYLRAGIIASASFNAMGAKTKPEDFVPNFDANTILDGESSAPRQSPEAQFAMFMLLKEAMDLQLASKDETN